MSQWTDVAHLLRAQHPDASVYNIPYPGQWSGLLTKTSKVTITFTDLPGETLGQTVGNAITLDLDAAGHGWFVDETPWDNSEYVATSNLNEWVAKSDSEAAGKMDLLCVLLHEYGHVLGLTHSEAAHTLMSDSLEAGERHTVSMDEMEAIYDHPDIALPSDPNSPSPATVEYLAPVRLHAPAPRPHGRCAGKHKCRGRRDAGSGQWHCAAAAAGQ